VSVLLRVAYSCCIFMIVKCRYSLKFKQHKFCITFFLGYSGRYYQAKRIFFRAIHSCAWSKDLWLDALSAGTLARVFSESELKDIRDVIEEKGILLRTT
jgi:hypothetical protein